jgi:hypothetical protein
MKNIRRDGKHRSSSCLVFRIELHLGAGAMKMGVLVSTRPKERECNAVETRITIESIEDLIQQRRASGPVISLQAVIPSGDDCGANCVCCLSSENRLNSKDVYRGTNKTDMAGPAQRM